MGKIVLKPGVTWINKTHVSLGPKHGCDVSAPSHRRYHQNVQLTLA